MESKLNSKIGRGSVAIPENHIEIHNPHKMHIAKTSFLPNRAACGDRVGNSGNHRAEATGAAAGKLGLILLVT
jgi:hypothetical protein